jgi:hypothetical protein
MHTPIILPCKIPAVYVHVWRILQQALAVRPQVVRMEDFKVDCENTLGRVRDTPPCTIHCVCLWRT